MNTFTCSDLSTCRDHCTYSRYHQAQIFLLTLWWVVSWLHLFAVATHWLHHQRSTCCHPVYSTRVYVFGVPSEPPNRSGREVHCNVTNFLAVSTRGKTEYTTHNSLVVSSVAPANPLSWVLRLLMSSRLLRIPIAVGNATAAPAFPDGKLKSVVHDSSVDFLLHADHSPEVYFAGRHETHAWSQRSAVRS